MKEVKLYGVTHAIGVDGLFREKTLEVAPPDNLLEHVGERHGIAGLELTSYPLDDLDSFYEELCMGVFKGNKFFRDLKLFLHNEGFGIEYLDDPRVVGYLQPRLHRFIDSVQGKLMYSPDDVGFLKEAKFQEVLILFDYLNAFVRDKYIREQLARSTATVAFMGLAHATLLAYDEELQEDLGIKVTELHHIQPDTTENELISLCYKWDVVSLDSRITEVKDDELKTLAEEISLENEITKRRHNAFSIGRVLDGDAPEPDYIGNFYYSGSSALSLFELFIDEVTGTSFKGRVFDVIGDAIVEGTISNGSVEFTKVYDPKKTPSKDTAPLFYQGHTDDDGMIRGRWETDIGKVGYGYCFNMHPFIKGRAMVKHLDLHRYE
jgi:hypothetical protein